MRREQSGTPRLTQRNVSRSPSLQQDEEFFTPPLTQRELLRSPPPPPTQLTAQRPETNPSMAEVAARAAEFLRTDPRVARLISGMKQALVLGKDVAKFIAPKVWILVKYFFNAMYALWNWFERAFPRVAEFIKQATTVMAFVMVQCVYEFGLYNPVMSILNYIDSFNDDPLEVMGKGYNFQVQLEKEEREEAAWLKRQEAKKVAERTELPGPNQPDFSTALALVPKAGELTVYDPDARKPQRYYLDMQDGRICERGVCYRVGSKFKMGRSVASAHQAIIDTDQLHGGYGGSVAAFMASATGIVLIASGICVYRTVRTFPNASLKVAQGVARGVGHAVVAGADFYDRRMWYPPEEEEEDQARIDNRNASVRALHAQRTVQTNRLATLLAQSRELRERNIERYGS